MSELSIAIIQDSLYWQNPEKNKEKFQKHIDALDSPVDLIVLPEMFTTGFTMDASENAEQSNGKTTSWMSEMAQSKNAVVTGSIIIEEGSKYYNRLIWAKPTGEFDTYDKRHLFRLTNEQDYFEAGTQRQIIELKGWKINLNICYDLRFPVSLRNKGDYDILLFVANWPSKRSHHWNTLLQARAIENLSYVVACNRIGADDHGLNYQGDSMVISPSGEILEHLGNERGVIHTKIMKIDLDNYRELLPFHIDADSFSF